jgi:hypothetical protein
VPAARVVPDLRGDDHRSIELPVGPGCADVHGDAQHRRKERNPLRHKAASMAWVSI